MLTIYKYTNKVNGKSYIGQTIDLQRRQWFHQHTNHCPVFNSAIVKYGWDSFTLEVLADGLTYEEANILEQQLIAEHNTQVPNGYNLREGGNNSSPSEETREKMRKAATGRVMSEATKQKLSATGKALRSSPEYREAQRQRRLGQAHTSERKLKISLALKGRVGHKHTDETKALMSESKKGVPKPKVGCPHCGLLSSATNIKRWHGDNCKLKESDQAS